jgi:hypothetical protein
MDANRFERLLRLLSGAPSRRDTVRLLSAAAVGGLLGGRAAPGDAKKGKKGKGKKKGKKSTPTCTPRCAGKGCDAGNGCGGTCDTCASLGQVCVGGSCQCPAGTQACQGACIADTATCCLTSADCDPGDLCVSTVCVTGQGTCANGDSVCVNATTCNTGCTCLQSTSGATRCAGDAFPGCDVCQTDAECAALHPTVPGVFCGATPGFCACSANPANTRCVPPCPN